MLKSEDISIMDLVSRPRINTQPNDEIFQLVEKCKRLTDVYPGERKFTLGRYLEEFFISHDEYVDVLDKFIIQQPFNYLRP
ncbi:hypothetical protein J2Z22_004777 [Paenibacillus forsythiae]|uniref:Uncharacterized protein n=1 Tax=Paenibacillus forsythiae TaxID=365616 RepID=A0ABU3HEC0_9BACL|nr:hypothetical protein [Paenibacillus forsythiae]